MRTRKKRKFDVPKRDSALPAKDRRKRLPVPVLRTGSPNTLHLTNEKIDEILFG
jgi:hypothetical protein